MENLVDGYKVLVIRDLVQLKTVLLMICFFNGFELLAFAPCLWTNFELNKSNISTTKIIYDKRLDYQTLQHPRIHP